ncbi:MAG TPA: ATP-binding protein [Candidatus Saccharimonadia bacterium]
MGLRGRAETSNRKTLGVLPKVWADKNRLKQIIYNLVGNATKFTTPGGITIDANPEGEFIKVTVADTGSGISPENGIDTLKALSRMPPRTTFRYLSYQTLAKKTWYVRPLILEPPLTW